MASSVATSLPPPASPEPSSQVESLSIWDAPNEGKAQAAQLKAEANAAFQRSEYTKAADLYTHAIKLDSAEPTLYANRAYARMKLEQHGYAIGDCAMALTLNSAYVKALYRRALCYIQIMKTQLAVADFKRILALEPQNALVRSQLETAQKLIRRAEFEKAIEFEEEKDAVERCKEIIAEDGCKIEKDYCGPHLLSEDNGITYGITPRFVSEMLEWFREGKTLARRYVWEIVLHAYDLFVREESLNELTLGNGMTCDVIGDVHGQFYDYLHLLSLTGHPSDKHCLIMNGDLVDRGSWSIEVVVTAFAFKWLYPNRMFINRGNHETKEMNRAYGFEGEAKHKHGEQTYKLFAHAFTALPLATMVNASFPPSKVSNPKPILQQNGCKRYFIVHGGLFSRDDVTLDDIRKIPRLGKQPGTEGVMCELLWTDPQDIPGRGPSKRGVGIAFGPDVTRRWCEVNKVTGIFRSHEVRQDGYAVEHDGLCTTVFSAPNYVDQGKNKGAFIRVDSEGSCDYRQFDCVPHPPMKPMAYASGGLANMLMM